MEHIPQQILDSVLAGMRPYWPYLAAMLAGLFVLQIITSRFRMWRREALRQHYREKVKRSRKRKQLKAAR